jgi:hypothetical protein
MGSERRRHRTPAGNDHDRNTGDDRPASTAIHTLTTLASRQLAVGCETVRPRAAQAA